MLLDVNGKCVRSLMIDEADITAITGFCCNQIVNYSINDIITKHRYLYISILLLLACGDDIG